MFLRKKNFNKIILVYVVIAVAAISTLIFFLNRPADYPKSLLDIDQSKKLAGVYTLEKEKVEDRILVFHFPEMNIRALDEMINQKKTEIRKEFEENPDVSIVFMDYESFQNGDCVSVQITTQITYVNEEVLVSVDGLSASQATGEVYDMASIINNKGLRVLTHDIRKQLPAYTNDNRMSYLRRTNPEAGSYTKFFINEKEFVFYVETPSGEAAIVKVDQIRLLPYFTTTLGQLTVDLEGKQESYYLESGADPAEKLIAITFDDGPRPHNDERIISILQKYNGQATFFMLGSELERHPEMVTTLADQGYQLANHSYNHVKINHLSAEEMEHQRTSVINTIQAQMDYDYPIMFRPPYGFVNHDELDRYQAPIIMWNVDSVDWQNKDNVRATVNQVMSTVSNRSIILFHDIHDATIDAFEIIAERLSQQGYKFVTVDELLRANNIPVNNGEIYYNGNE